MLDESSPWPCSCIKSRQCQEDQVETLSEVVLSHTERDNRWLCTSAQSRKTQLKTLTSTQNHLYITSLRGSIVEWQFLIASLMAPLVDSAKCKWLDDALAAIKGENPGFFIWIIQVIHSQLHGNPNNRSALQLAAWKTCAEDKAGQHTCILKYTNIHPSFVTWIYKCIKIYVDNFYIYPSIHSLPLTV